MTAKFRPATSFVSPSAASFAAAFTTSGNFCRVVMMMRAPWPSRASLSWLECLSTLTIVPGVWSSPATVSWSCLSRILRSVTTTTLSKIGWSATSCNREREWAVHAMVLDFPDPAECITSRSVPAPAAYVAARIERTACHWWKRGKITRSSSVWMKFSISSSQASRSHTCSHRYAVSYPPLGGLPDVPGCPAPAEPWLKGRKRVSCPAKLVVIATWCGSTAKWTKVRLAKIRSCGFRSVRYWVIACSRPCPVNGFFNSAVATGTPLTANVRSSDDPGLDSEWCNCRMTLSRLAAYWSANSGVRVLAGLNAHIRTVTPESLTLPRRTLIVPR